MNKQLIELNAIKDLSGIWFDVAAEVADYNLRTEVLEVKNLTLTNSYNYEEVILVEDLAHMPDRFSQMTVGDIEDNVITNEMEADLIHRESVRLENQMDR